MAEIENNEEIKKIPNMLTQLKKILNGSALIGTTCITHQIILTFYMNVQ